MKKRLLLLLALVAIPAMFFNAMAQIELATFEEDNVDYFTELGYVQAAENGSLTISNNPLIDGINTTEKVLKFSTAEGKDWSNSIGKIYGENEWYIDIDEDYSYLHVMVYCPVPGAAGRLVLRSGVADDHWGYQDVEANRYDFNFDSSQWKDIVVDLKDKVSGLYGFYFFTQYWGGAPAGCNMYFDNFELSNNPFPRGADMPIMEASILANFEDNGVILNLQSVGNATFEFGIENNPETTKLNKTDKTFYAKINTIGEWWGGVEGNFYKSVYVTESTQYMHIMVKTNSPKFEFDIFSDGEKWAGAINPDTDEWVDYVINLSAFNGNNLTGKLVTGMRIVLFPNEADNKGKDIYIDEIIVNNDPTPREVETGTKLNNNLIQNEIVFSNSNGISILNLSDNVKVYDISGSLVFESSSKGDLNVELSKGLYFVNINNRVCKVLVK